MLSEETIKEIEEALTPVAFDIIREVICEDLKDDKFGVITAVPVVEQETPFTLDDLRKAMDKIRERRFYGNRSND